MSFTHDTNQMVGNGSDGLVKSLYKAASRSTRLLILMALISLVFGVWGWFELSESLGLNFGDIVYRSLAGLSLSPLYQTSAKWSHDWRIDVARWSGVIAVVIGAGKTVFLLLEQHWKRKQAERRRGHWLVVGDDPFAQRLCNAAMENRLYVNWLAMSESTISHHNKRLFVDQSNWALERAKHLGIARAVGTVVAMNDDAATYAIAREIRKAIPDEKQHTVMASIRSPWLAMRVDEIEGVKGIRIFSEAQIAVRRQQRRNPPFLIAERLGHTRLHTVICDFSQYGEAVLIETMLSSLTIKLQKPLFTIIDPHVDSIRNDLRIRYPELEESADLVFIEGRVFGARDVIELGKVAGLTKSVPISLCYSCHLCDEISLSTALALQVLTLKSSEDTAGPVFTRLSSSDTLPEAPIGAKELMAGQLIAFGALEDLANETGLFSNRVDRLAQQFHKDYLSIASDTKTAKLPWEELSEDLRDANRRLVVHIPAKLHSLGLDLESWLVKTEKAAEVIKIPKVSNPNVSENKIKKMAVLEHDRWMADRRINGWVYGPIRDDLRRVHTDLVAFDQLSEESKSYDREFVLSLLNLCGRTEKGKSNDSPPQDT